MRKNKLINRTRFYVALLLISFILSFTSIITKKSFGDSLNSQDYNYYNYIVRNNDTIWNIAKKFNTYKIDIREFIDIIIEENNINDSLILPGEKLRIPILK